MGFHSISRFWMRRFRLPAPVVLCCASAFCLSLISPPARAATSTIAYVEILEYLGFQGYDEVGKPLYGVKVKYRDSDYYVELFSPMLCLMEVEKETVQVTLEQEHQRWERVTYDGESSLIHRVIRIDNSERHTWAPPPAPKNPLEGREPDYWSPFYYND